MYTSALQTQVIRGRQEEDILDWILPSSSKYITPKHGKEFNDTCERFLRSTEYLEWVGQGPSTLICVGARTACIVRLSDFRLAGSGKSHLVFYPPQIFAWQVRSVIFNRLLKTPELGILYFFFNHSDREQTAENVIRVLLRQLLDQLGKIPNDVRNEYSRYKNDPHKIMPDRDKYANMLKGSIEEFFKAKQNRIFILVDAYDELLSSKEERLEKVAAERVAVRSCLAKLTETENAKVLITTRSQHREELKQSFVESNIVHIHGDLKDMTIYLENRMEPLNLQDAMKVEIIETLLKKNEEEKW